RIPYLQGIWRQYSVLPFEHLRPAWQGKRGVGVRNNGMSAGHHRMLRPFFPSRLELCTIEKFSVEPQRKNRHVQILADDSLHSRARVVPRKGLDPTIIVHVSQETLPFAVSP